MFDRWVDENGDIALPLYEGRMIGHFDFSQKGWLSGRGRTAQWRAIPFDFKQIKPQFLMSSADVASKKGNEEYNKVVLMDIVRTTVSRTMTCVAHHCFPCGHSAPVLYLGDNRVEKSLLLSSMLNSMCFDFVVRRRVGGLHMSLFLLEECPLPLQLVSGFTGIVASKLVLSSASLTYVHRRFAPEWLKLKRSYPELAGREWKHWWAVTEAGRLRLRIEIDALCADLYGLDPDDFDWIVRDDPTDPKGFYRVDRQLPFRERLTGLAAAAFRALKDGRWSAESAASLSNDEFFEILSIPELTNAQAAHALGLPGPLIEKRDGCHTWRPESFPPEDPRHGWTWDDCWKDAVALLGGEEALSKYLEAPLSAASPEHNLQQQTTGKDGQQAQMERTAQGRLF